MNRCFSPVIFFYVEVWFFCCRFSPAESNSAPGVRISSPHALSDTGFSIFFVVGVASCHGVVCRTRPQARARVLRATKRRCTLAVFLLPPKNQCW